MKQIKYLAASLLTCAIVFALALPATAEPAKMRTGKVVRIKGSARYTTDGTTWQTLKVGDDLKAGSVVQTAKGSYADIVLGDASVSAPGGGTGSLMDYQPVAQRDAVRLLEDTTLAFDKLTMTQSNADTITDTQCDLRSGKLFFTVKKMLTSSRFEIKIPNGVAGIRGTIGMVSSEGIMSILAGSGVMAFSKSDGSLLTQVVPGGYMFDARSNELSRLTRTMEGGLQRMSQECYFPGPPPTHTPPPYHHYSPYQNGQGGNNGPPPPIQN